VRDRSYQTIQLALSKFDDSLKAILFSTRLGGCVVRDRLERERERVRLGVQVSIWVRDLLVGQS
jgi:hypothetical protein